MCGSDEEYDISIQDENKCVKEAVKAILVLDYSKKPFKHADVLKYLSKKPNRKQWNSVIEKSKKSLKEMGLTLVETKKTSAKSFILISNNFPLPSMHKLANESEVADRTLLIFVLTYIFMKEESVSDVDLFKHLEELDIYSEEKPVHEYFGDVKKKILNEFVSQLYLEKIIDKETDKVILEWGERALAEVSKRSILEFVVKIGYEGSIEPKSLVSHYQAVLEEEKTTDHQHSQDNSMMIDS